MVVVYRNEKNELIACGHIKHIEVIDDMLHFTKDDDDGFGRMGKIVEVIA